MRERKSSLCAESGEPVVNVKMEMSMMRRSRTVDVRRVYEQTSRSPEVAK